VNVRRIAPVLPAVLAALTLTLVSDGASRATAPLDALIPLDASGDRAPDTSARTPVLVELFTSEGCSSCPPADTLLSRMAAEQPVPGAEIVPLAFHVDYWDDLGWRDRFASAQHTFRQNLYARWQPSWRVYTPQAVVDGARELVGSDWNAARTAIATSAAAPKLAVSVDLAPPGTDAARVPLRVAVTPSAGQAGKADVMLAVAEDGLVSEVKRGENANLRLAHGAVVRTLQRIGKFDGQSPYAASHAIEIEKHWRRDALTVVVFLQDASTHRIIGIATRRL